MVVLLLLAWCGLGWAVSSRQVAVSAAMAAPQRIVSLAPNVTEILYAIDLGPQIVGVCTFCDYPPEALAKPLIGAYWQPDIEAIIAKHPDLVIGETYPQHAEILDRLARMGYATASLKTETISEFFDALSQLGRLTAREPQAAALERDMKAKFVEIARSVAGRPRLRVLWVVDAQPLRVAGRDTFINEMIEIAGGENAIGPTIHPYPPVGIEQVMAARVDVIIQPSMNPSIPIETQQAQVLAQWNNWPAIPAVKEGRIYVIDADAVSRLGPRLARGAEMLARILHPESFQDDVTGDNM